MRKLRFPRRAQIAAALFASFAFLIAPTLSASGPGSSYILSHNFFDGFTDIPFSGVNDILQLDPKVPGGLRIIFDHNSPLSYNKDTKLFAVQAVGGFTEDFTEFHPKVNIAANIDNSGVIIRDAAGVVQDAPIYSCG